VKPNSSVSGGLQQSAELLELLSSRVRRPGEVERWIADGVKGGAIAASQHKTEHGGDLFWADLPRSSKKRRSYPVDDKKMLRAPLAGAIASTWASLASR
jgi:hypothetical protein